MVKHNLVVANQASHLELIQAENRSQLKRKLGLYNNKQKILLVGEGDFSFAAALCTKFGGDNIVATCLDSKEELKKKYGTSGVRNVGIVKESKGKVFYSVDVTDLNMIEFLTNHLKQNFDVTVFNFPHVGGSTKADISRNQSLISDFVLNIFKAKTSNQVHITLRDTSFYSSWNLEEVIYTTFSKLNKTSRKSKQIKVKVQKLKNALDLNQFAQHGYQEVRTSPGLRAAPGVSKTATYVVTRRCPK